MVFLIDKIVLMGFVTGSLISTVYKSLPELPSGEYRLGLNYRKLLFVNSVKSKARKDAFGCVRLEADSVGALVATDGYQLAFAYRAVLDDGDVPPPVERRVPISLRFKHKLPLVAKLDRAFVEVVFTADSVAAHPTAVRATLHYLDGKPKDLPVELGDPEYVDVVSFFRMVHAGVPEFLAHVPFDLVRAAKTLQFIPLPSEWYRSSVPDFLIKRVTADNGVMSLMAQVQHDDYTYVVGESRGDSLARVPEITSYFVPKAEVAERYVSVSDLERGHVKVVPDDSNEGRFKVCK